VFFFQAEDGIRDRNVTGVQTCALPIFAAVNATGQLTNAAVRTETVGMAQHHRLLGEGMAVGIARLQPDAVKGIPTDLLQPLACRSEERRVGKEGSTRGAAAGEKTNQQR